MSNRLTPIGTITKLGEVVGVRTENGERQYFVVRDGCVAIYPQDVVERAIREEEI